MVGLNNLEDITKLKYNLENNQRGKIINVKYSIMEVIMIFLMMKSLFLKRVLLL